MYKKKYNADRTLEWSKARVVAKEFNQRPGQNYFETFVSTNSDINIEIYMEEPDGFKTKQGGKKIVYWLNKSLYG